MMRTSFPVLLGLLVLLPACTSINEQADSDFMSEDPNLRLPRGEQPVEIHISTEFQGYLTVMEWKKHQSYTGDPVEGWDYYGQDISESGPFFAGDSFVLPPTGWLQYFPEEAHSDDDLTTLAALPRISLANLGLGYHFDVQAITRVGRCVEAFDMVQVAMPPGPPDAAFIAFARRPYVRRLRFFEHAEHPVSKDALRLLDLPGVESLELGCRGIDEEILTRIIERSPKLMKLKVPQPAKPFHKARKLAEERGVSLSYRD